MSPNRSKILIWGGIVIGILIWAFFQWSVIKVSANTDDNFVLKISVPEISFGTVFPQETLSKEFDISFSDEFYQLNQGDRVVYKMKEEAKPGVNPDLCSHIDEKIDGVLTNPLKPEFLTLNQDETDLVTVELTVPCFLGMCELGYNGPTLNPVLQGDIFGCDLWVEVSDVFYKDQVAGIWHFDEGEGDIAYDSSGWANHGSVSGAGWTTGKENNALNFDGIDDYVSVPASSNLNPSSFTYQFWLYNTGQVCAAHGRLCRVISRASDTFEVAVARAGGSPSFIENNLYIYTGSAWLNTGYTVALNTWTQIKITFDSASQTFKVYADEINVYTNSPINISQSGELSFGRRINGTGENFKGIIDEVKFYNQVF